VTFVRLGVPIFTTYPLYQDLYWLILHLLPDDWLCASVASTPLER
jgi:hypothetical protein